MHILQNQFQQIEVLSVSVDRIIQVWSAYYHKVTNLDCELHKKGK